MNRRRFLRGCLALLAAPVLPVAAAPRPMARLLYGGFVFPVPAPLPKGTVLLDRFPLNTTTYRLSLE